jgi:hypothetical protein
MDSVQGCYPEIFLDQAEQQGVITREQKAEIMGRNVLNWIGQEANTGSLDGA